jgi:hypothetical protein
VYVCVPSVSLYLATIIKGAIRHNKDKK